MAGGVVQRTTDLLERDELLARLAATLERAADGAGSLVVVEGEPGIGKTALLDAAADAAHARAMRVLRGRGAPLERDHPYGLLRQALDGTLLRMGAADRAPLFAGAAAPAAAVLLPDASASATGDEPGALLRALYWVLAELAADRPAALLLDDLHWADARTLELVDFLSRRVDDLSLAVVVAFRPAEPGSDAQLLAGLAAAAGSERLAPAPLSEEAVATAVAEQLAAEPAPAFAAACLAATGGNPFLLAELLRELRTVGVCPTAGEARRVGEVAPPGIVRSVLLRLGRLTDGGAAFARAAAVMGDGAGLPLVARLAGVDDVAAAEQARLLAALGVLAPGTGVRFSHPLVRSAIYDDVGWERDAMHAAAARVLLDAGAPPEQIASHAAATSAPLDDELRAAVRRAATVALERGAPEIAVGHLRRALEGAGAGRAELLLDLGRATLAAGDAASAVVLLDEAARASADPHAAGVAALELGRATMMSGDLHGAVELLDDARARLDPEDRELALALEVEAVGALRFGVDTRGRLEERLRALRATVTVDGSLPDERRLLAHLSFEALIEGEPCDAVLDMATRALGDDELIREEGPGSPLVYMPISALSYSGACAAARRHLAVAMDAARVRGSAAGFAMISALQAMTEYRAGALLDAETAARAALDREAAAPLDQPIALGALLETLLEQGRAAEGIAELDRHGGPAAELPMFPLYTPLAYGRGRARAAAGDLDGGLADLLDTGRRAAAFGSRNPIYAWRTAAAPLLVAQGRHDEAVALADEELALARAYGAPRAVGIALRGRALLDTGDAQIDGLRLAVEVLEGSEARLELARALVDLGAALRRTRRRSEAREPLARGRDLAHRCGAAALVDRAGEELLASGARPRRIVRSGADALTASERRVARMAADGLTNRAIAQALFVTMKTVETHLRSAYRKLDVAGRAELAVALDLVGVATDGGGGA